MVPPKLNFCSISRKESQDSQQEYALRSNFFCEHYCVRMTFLFPATIGNLLMRKRTSIFDRVCFNYEQLIHPVQCTACKICQGSSRDNLASPEVTGILSFSDQLHHL